MNNKVLCVDDDTNLIDGYKRNLRSDFEFEGALSARKGLEMIIHKGPFAVVISDMRMPETDGIKFLSVLKEKFPDTVRIMLTGNADLQTAINAVNSGHVFQFLTKPCPPDILKKSIIAGLKQYQLITLEKELLEKTLKGTIKLLSDILSITNLNAFIRASKISRMAVKIARTMNYKDLWKIEIASMLSQIGYIVIPDQIVSKVNKGETLDAKEQEMILQYPKTGYDLLSNIPRLEETAKIIYYQEKRYDGAGFPEDSIKGDDIPIESRILKIVIDFDAINSAGISEMNALNKMKNRPGWYDSKVIKLLEDILGKPKTENETSNIYSVNMADLKENMILTEDIVSVDGQILVSKGQEITQYIKMRLKNYSKNTNIKEPIKVTYIS